MAISHRSRRTHLSRPTLMFAIEAQNLLAADQATEAVELCKRGLIYYPEHVTGYVVLSQAYLDLGSRERALNVLSDGYRRTGSDRLDQIHAELARDLMPQEEFEPLDEKYANGRDARAATARWEVPARRGDHRGGTLRERMKQATRQQPTRQQPTRQQEVKRPALWNRLEEIESERKQRISRRPAASEEARLRENVWMRKADLQTEPNEADDAITATPTEAEAEQPAPAAEQAPQPVILSPERTEEAAEQAAAHGAEAIAPEPPDQNLVPETVTSDEMPADELMAISPEVVLTEKRPVAGDEPSARPDSVTGAGSGELPPVEEFSSGQEGMEVAEVPGESFETTPEVAATEGLSHQDAGVETTGLDTALPPAEPAYEQKRPTIELAEPDIIPGMISSDEAELFPEVDQAAPDEQVEIQKSWKPDISALPASVLPDLGFSEPRAQMDTLVAPSGPERRVSQGAMAVAGAEAPRHLSLALHAGKNIARLRSSNLRLIPGLEYAPLRSGEQSPRQTIAPLINEPLPELDFPERSPSRGDAASRISIPAPGGLPPLDESLPTELTASQAVGHDEPVQFRYMEPMSVPMPDSSMQGTQFQIHEEAPQQTAPRKHRLSPLEAIASAGAARNAESPTNEPEDLSPLEELARRLEHARIPVIEEDEQPLVFEPSIVSETLANILVTQGKYAEALKAFQTLARMKPERFEHLQHRILEMKWRLHNPGKEWPPQQQEDEEFEE